MSELDAQVDIYTTSGWSQRSSLNLVDGGVRLQKIFRGPPARPGTDGVQLYCLRLYLEVDCFPVQLHCLIPLTSGALTTIGEWRGAPPGTRGTAVS